MAAKNELRTGTIDEIQTTTIPQFRQISNLGNTKVHDLINNGLRDADGNIVIDDDGNALKLETVAIGSRRLIVLDSWRRIIEHQRRHPVKLGLRGRRREAAE
jgi:hypothetical protein